jgi:hypothetical protein
MAHHSTVALPGNPDMSQYTQHFKADFMLQINLKE